MGETLELKGYCRTDIGQVRLHNEDRLCVVPPFPDESKIAKILIDKGKGILLAVADGMGGTNAGEVAAEIAIQTVKNSTEKINSMLLRPAEIGKGLESIIYKAHLDIKASLNEENAGMGTTLILALISGNKVFVAWCGDSRAYKYSPQLIERENKFDLPNLKILTRDHSVVWQMVMKGELDPNEAREHEMSNVITQSLGDPSKDPKPESAMFSIAPGDKILVCSDGLNGMLPDEFIQEILAHDRPLDELGNSLVEAANAAGGDDNVTLILAQIESVPESIAPIIKPGKERPEAITAKSSLSDPAIDMSVRLHWIMKPFTLITITILALLIIIYLNEQNRLTYPVGQDLKNRDQPAIISPKDSTRIQSLKDSLAPSEVKNTTISADTNNRNEIICMISIFSFYNQYR